MEQCKDLQFLALKITFPAALVLLVQVSAGEFKWNMNKSSAAELYPRVSQLPVLWTSYNTAVNKFTCGSLFVLYTFLVPGFLFFTYKYMHKKIVCINAFNSWRDH